MIANSHEGFVAGEARRPLPSSSPANAVVAMTAASAAMARRVGLHPPSALIATTSAVPSPAIMNPTLQLP